MGWSSGGSLAAVIEDALAPILKDADPALVREAGDKIAAEMQDMDADTLDECDGFIGDAANRADHPGAPKNPKKGDTYKARWGTATFDGRRWQYD